jgi:hypothetical protein
MVPINMTGTGLQLLARTWMGKMTYLTNEEKRNSVRVKNGRRIRTRRAGGSSANVPERTDGTEGAPHAGHAEDREARRGYGGGSFVAHVASGGRRERVQHGSHKEKGQLVQLPSTGRRVFQQQTVADETGHDPQKANEQPEQLVVLSG